MLIAVAWQCAQAQDVVASDNNDVNEVSEALDSKHYNKWTKSANFKNGIKAMDTQQYDKSTSLLEKELKQHPHNGYAQCNLAWCKYLSTSAAFNEAVYNLINEAAVDGETAQKTYSRIYESVKNDYLNFAQMLNKGIDMLPNADKETLCKAYLKHAAILHQAEADSAALAHSLQQAIKIHPCYESYVEIMRFYINNNDTHTATVFAIEAGDILDGDYNAQRLKAFAYQYQKDYPKALQLIDKLLEENDADIDVLVARCEIHTDQGDYKAALADYDLIVNSSEPNEFEPFKLLDQIAHISPEAHSEVIDYVKHQQENDAKTDGTINWNVLEGMIRYNNQDYKESMKCFERGLGTNHSAELVGIVASNYFMLGEADKALALCDIADGMQQNNKSEDEDDDNNSTSGTFLSRKIILEMTCGMAHQVLNDAQVSCIAYPQNSNIINCLSIMGWAHTALGQYNDAIHNYEQWMEIDHTNVIPRYNRARTMIQAGIDLDEAAQELREILETQDFTGNEELKMTVLYYLGRKTEARELLDKLAASTNAVEAMTLKEREQATSLPEVMSLYNLACSYSLLGDTEQALDYLRRNFQGSGDDSLYFNYAILDTDFDNVRQDPRFLDIINEFKTRWLNGDYKPLNK